MDKTSKLILALCLVVVAVLAWAFVLSSQSKQNAASVQIQNDPLFMAIHSKDYATVKRIVSARPSVLAQMHSAGGTYMNCAAASKDTKMMKLLLDLGGDPNGVAGCGMAPIILACNNNDLAMLELLLKAGADPNVFGHGMCPLTLARKSKNTAMEKLLLKYHAKEVSPLATQKEPKKKKSN